jgi:hypothetical protein
MKTAQSLARDVHEWMRINSGSRASHVLCFAAAVLEKSISVSNGQKQQETVTILDCSLWFQRLSIAKSLSPSPNNSAASSADGAAAFAGLPRLLLMLMQKGQFSLAEQVINCYTAGSGGSSPTSVIFFSSLPHPFSMLFSNMITLESLATSSSSSSSAAADTKHVQSKVNVIINSIRALLSEAPPASPLTPTVNAFISGITSRCAFIESNFHHSQQQEQSDASPPWWSHLFVQPRPTSARLCDVDVNLSPQCVIFR